LKFNETGIFEIFEKNLNKEVPNFVMNETLTVVNQPHSLISVSKENSTSAPIAKLGAAHIDTIDIIRTYMVPAKDISKDIAALTNRELYVDSTFTYKDAREGQKGTGLSRH